MGRRRGRLHRAINDLTGLVEVTRRIAAQTRQRLSGEVPAGATRRVSLHDEDARPIAKGRLGKPIEFGYKAQVMDNDDGIVPDHTVERGNPGADPERSPPTAATAKPASRPACTSSASRPSRSPARADPAKPARPSSIARRSVEASSGAPAARHGSAPSNGSTDGTEPASITSTGPGSGPDTGSWPTTSSRSPR